MCLFTFGFAAAGGAVIGEHIHVFFQSDVQFMNFSSHFPAYIAVVPGFVDNAGDVCGAIGVG